MSSKRGVSKQLTTLPVCVSSSFLFPDPTGAQPTGQACLRTTPVGPLFHHFISPDSFRDDEV